MRLRASTSVALWLVLAFTRACAPPAPLDDRFSVRPPGGVPDAREAFAVPLAELRARLEACEARARDHEASARGVRAAGDAAALARLLSLREGRGEMLDRGRRWLEKASRRKALPGACEAALAWAALEARDAGRLDEAYAVAYGATRRYGGASDPEVACVARARRFLSILEPFRPGPERLSAIDADPDADDPSVPRPPSAEPGVPGWAREPEPARVPLTHVAIYGSGGTTQPEEDTVVRAVIHLGGMVPLRQGELRPAGGLPRRLYVDFQGAFLAPEARVARQVEAAGLHRVRTGQPEEGVARVVFELEPDARYQLFFLREPYRVVIDFERGSPRRTKRRGPRIVLDPGHGADDFGARYGELRESVLALDLARRTRRLLARRLPEAEILMTRDTDASVTLEERSAMANAADADLFVSIHLNSADDPVTHGGVTTFVLDTNDDAQATRLAARENGTSVEQVTGLQRLLASLHREEQARASTELASSVQQATVRAGRFVVRDLPDRGVKRATFFVLVGARMPAVLVEASFLTHPKEATALRTVRYRRALAEGMAEGIATYLMKGSPR